MFAERYEFILKQVIPLENGLPSKDTIRRVMQVIHLDVLNEVTTLWTDLLMESNRQATGKLIAIDGKTMCGNQQNETKPLHIVSAYSVEAGICFGQTAVEERSNEITAIPKLLSSLN